ncbi:hypothetical protein Mame01_68470 [Microbispora amethystogenes]|nr:hypothetical protein Mame01_68470 [Microbispora amethystogenes]
MCSAYSSHSDMPAVRASSSTAWLITLEWAKSLSKRLSEGAYTMADDPGSWRTVPGHLKMRF